MGGTRTALLAGVALKNCQYSQTFAASSSCTSRRHDTRKITSGDPKQLLATLADSVEVIRYLKVAEFQS